MSDGAIFVVSILTIVATIGIFLIARELVCWYYKINKRLDNQERIIDLLVSINEKLSDKERIRKGNNPASPDNIKFQPKEGTKTINDLYSKK